MVDKIKKLKILSLLFYNLKTDKNIYKHYENIKKS